MNRFMDDFQFDRKLDRHMKLFAINTIEPIVALHYSIETNPLLAAQYLDKLATGVEELPSSIRNVILSAVLWPRIVRRESDNRAIICPSLRKAQKGWVQWARHQIRLLWRRRFDVDNSWVIAFPGRQV